MMAFAQLAAAEEESLYRADAPHPVELNTSNFNQVVDSQAKKVVSDKPWFIKFYAPWCGHCKHLAPTWTDLYESHQEELNVGHVDCTSDLGKGLCQLQEIRGYPTLLYFSPDPAHNDKFFKYQGPRSIDALEKFALTREWKTSEN